MMVSGRSESKHFMVGLGGMTRWVGDWSADSRVRAFLASHQFRADKAVRAPVSPLLESALVGKSAEVSGQPQRSEDGVAGGLRPSDPGRNKTRRSAGLLDTRIAWRRRWFATSLPSP